MKYGIYYWAEYEVEAETEEEAIDKFGEMLDNGEAEGEVEMEDLDFGDDGFEVL